MNILEQNRSIELERPDLDGLPSYELPEGYAASWYAPGDEQHWVDIHVQADRYNTITVERYWRAFGDNAAVLGRRQLFLRAGDGAVVGTATAWYGGESPDTPLGRVHWVAIVPTHQGRGLAKPLLALVCWRLRELGHQRAYLDTSTARVTAVNLYRQFGFAPRIASSEDRAIWQELTPFLKAPLDLG